MTHWKQIGAAVAAHLLLLSVGLGAEDASSPISITIGPEGARPLSLTIDGRDVSLPSGGGFQAYDATAKKPVALSRGQVKQTSQGDIHLKKEVESSGCKDPDGRYCLVIRNTPWGENSVTFKMNPNPDLFKNQNRPTVASYALDLMDRWLKEHPEYDGMFVDSLGRNWPAVLNYRKDHFAYARHPLTFDPQGRVALHNQISHYEYIDALRARMRAAGRLVLANGVYAYKPRVSPAKRVQRQALDKTLKEYIERSAPAEHYRPGARVGRFFCAALLDVASSEAGVRATIQRCQDVRAFMGRKQYAFLNYSWEDGAKVEELVNRSLCYGIFASTSTNFFTEIARKTPLVVKDSDHVTFSVTPLRCCVIALAKNP